MFERELTHPRTPMLALVVQCLAGNTHSVAEDKVQEIEASRRCEDLAGVMEAPGAAGSQRQSPRMTWDGRELQSGVVQKLEMSGGETGSAHAARKVGAEGELHRRSSGSGQEAGSEDTVQDCPRWARRELQAQNVCVYSARDRRGDGAHHRSVERAVIPSLCGIRSWVSLPMILAVPMKGSCKSITQKHTPTLPPAAHCPC